MTITSIQQYFWKFAKKGVESWNLVITYNTVLPSLVLGQIFSLLYCACVYHFEISLHNEAKNMKIDSSFERQWRSPLNTEWEIKIPFPSAGTFNITNRLYLLCMKSSNNTWLIQSKGLCRTSYHKLRKYLRRSCLRSGVGVQQSQPCRTVITCLLFMSWRGSW